MADFDFDEIDVTLERRIIIGCIVSTEFLKDIISIYDRRYMSTNGAQKIMRWCIAHYGDYEKAPGKHIEDIYNAQVRKKTLDKDEIKFISTILDLISDEWEETAQDLDFKFLADECEDFFSASDLSQTAEEIHRCALNGDVDKAHTLITDYKKVARPTAQGINPLVDEAAVRAAFEARTEPLFKLPGELGRYLNEQLYRSAFVAFQGPEKSGKSHILLEIAMRALRSRCKVAIFEMGDMTQNDRICRIQQYMSMRPFLRSRSDKLKMQVRIPELFYDDEGTPFVKIRTEDRPILFWEDALKMGEKWEKRIGKNRIKLSPHAIDTTSVSDIERILEHWRVSENWVPDVIIIDYADILAPDDPRKQERTQVNDTWKALRKLSQQRNALVVTATQADSKSYGSTSQTLKNFSNDKRKYAHVTAMYSINQTFKEKPQFIIRIGTLLVREGTDYSNKEVAMLRGLDFGRPYLDSYLVDVDYDAIRNESAED